MRTAGYWLCVAAALSLRIFIVHACHILQLTSEGFGGNLLHLLHAVAIYEGSGGGAFLIDHSRFPYRCDDRNVGGIPDFFNHTGLRPWSRERQKAAEDEEKQQCKWLDFLSLDHQVALLGATWDELDSIALRRIWHLQPAVQEEVDAVLKDTRRFKRPIIGFHVRGGDLVGHDEELLFNEAPVSKSSDLIGTFLETYPDVRGGTCLLVGDDHMMIDEAARVAKQAIGCEVHKRKKFYRKSGFSETDFNQETSEQRCSSTKHLIADMELLARADYCVASFDSSLPYIIQTMRFALHLKDRRTFVDASPKHRDWYQSIRNYFKEQEANRAMQPGKPRHMKMKGGL